MTYIIETSDLTKLYNGFPALDNINVKIPKGITGIVGANGAGKTTLIRILLGILPPTSGSATIFGEPINTQEVRQKIGYMSELDSHFPDISSMKYIGHLGQMSGIPRTTALQRAHDILTFVGLGEERHRKIKTYSKGMMQKMKLAQALVHSPMLIFLDEPTDGLDPESRSKMLNLIKKLQNQGINVIISTHILPDIQRIGRNNGSLLIIHKGKLLQAGKLEKFLNRFENLIIIEVESNNKTNYSDFLSELNSEKFKYRKISENRIEIQLKQGLPQEYQLINQIAIKQEIRILELGKHAFTLDEAFIDLFQQETKFREGKVPGR